MKTAREKFEKLRQRLESRADAVKAAPMAAYMRNRFAFYGVAAPERKLIFKDLIAADSRSNVIDWELLNLCFDDCHREMQYFVVDYLKALKRLLTYADVPRLRRFVARKQWWDTIDGLDRIIGSIGLSDPRLNALMLRWSTDPDFWIRRVAIDHQIGRKEQTNTELLAAILVNNFGSREFFINKAIGWSLREYSKTNPQWVKRFLETHRSEMAPLSIREASKRL
jgi:3-methyladenine DNA glycosylase AlkD